MIDVESETFLLESQNEGVQYEPYNPEIHPWSMYGPCDIEIGIGWKDSLKQKLGYCIFCGDGLPVPDQSGSL